MEKLTMACRIVLANTFVLYFKAHSHHWNIRGMEFSQLHDFFADIYQDAFGAVDTIAEEIRALNEDAPKSLSEMYQYKTVNEGNIAETAEQMLQDLQITNTGVLDSLNIAMNLAEDANEKGLSNFFQDRIDKHKKNAWMIGAHLK
jgi:starvation-inducible DNA-binding protein